MDSRGAPGSAAKLAHRIHSVKTLQSAQPEACSAGTWNLPHSVPQRIVSTSSFSLLQSARAQGGGAQLPASFFEDSNGGGAAERPAPVAEAQYASNEAFRVDASGAAAAEVGPTRPPASGYADYGSYAGYGDGGYAGYDAAQQQYAGAGDA